MASTNDITCKVRAPINQPEFPQFIDQMVRLQTFGGWPETSKKKPDQLSHAGFFYNQTENRVFCFCCGASKSVQYVMIHGKNMRFRVEVIATI